MSLGSLWFRPLLARPLRFLATVLGVAIGVASILSTVLASRAAVASLGADVEEISGGALLEVRRPGGVDLADFAAVRGVGDAVRLSPVVEEVLHLPALGDLVRVLGVDLLVDREARGLELDAGEDSAAALDAMLLGRGVALSRQLADALATGPGGQIEAVVEARTVSLDVAAVFEPERFASAWERVLVVDVATAQELFGRSDVDRVEVHPRPGLATPPETLAALAGRLRAGLPQGYEVAPASARRQEGERMVRALSFNLTALSGVSLLVGMVLIATTLATSVVQRRHAIALLRSLGASRAQLTGALLAEAGVLGLAGGALGVLLGWGAAHLSVDSVRTTFATVVPEALAGEIVLELRWVLLGLGAGLGTALVAALLPLREALAVPPVQGLRRERPRTSSRAALGRSLALAGALVLAAVGFAALPPLGDRPIWALASALVLLSTLLVLAGPLVDLGARLRLGSAEGPLGSALRVAQAGLAAGRRRASWAAGAVGVAVGLAVAMATMVGSFRQTVVDWTEQTMRSDLFVRPVLAESGAVSGTIDPWVADVARTLFGADRVDAFHASRARVDGQSVELAGGEFAVLARTGGVPFLDGRPSSEVFRAALEQDAVVVNEPFARRFDLWTGDTVALETPGGRLVRPIAGVYRDYSGHNGRVVLERAAFLERYPEEDVRSLAVFLDPSEDPRAARDRLLDAIGGRYALDVLLGGEVRREILQVFERTFAVTVALQLLAVAVAAIAVVTVLGSLVRERRHDLAVVRVLGASARQVASVVLGQALLLGLAGAAGGLVVGLGVGYVLVAVVNLQSFGWTLRFLPPWGTLAGTVGLVVPACLLAGLVPALLALRHQPREELREAV